LSACDNFTAETKTLVTIFYIDYDFVNNPDLVQTFAFLHAALGLNLQINNAANLRHKETDRIAAIAKEIEKIGGNIFLKSDNESLEKINIFQFLCIVLSFIVAIVLSLYKIKHESLSQLWTLAKMKNRVTVFDLHKDLTTKFTIFNQLICTPLPWAALAGLFLPNFKRYNSKNNEKKCNYVFLSDLPFMVIVNTIVFVSGAFVCFIFFFGCDPLGSQQIQNKNQVGVYW
jgi:hypothetical protein